MVQGTLGTAAYDTDPDVWTLDLHSNVYPDGIVITDWYVDCNEADPDTELDADLKYCDAVGTGAFPGANPVTIAAINTTTGNSSATGLSKSIPSGKTLYITINSDIVSDTTLFHVRVHYYIPSS